MNNFTMGQKVIYWQLATQLHPTRQIEATYCGPHDIARWRRHKIQFTGDDGRVNTRYVSLAAIRAANV